MMKQFLFLFITSLCLVTGCAQKEDKNDYLVTIKTKHGDMVAILYDETPKHKENFIKLAKEKFYDSLLFHRVIQNFMIQGGDPDSKNAEQGKDLGMGGPGYTIEAEFNPHLFHEKGALSAARLGDQQNPTKASSGSQFYIVQGSVVKEADVEYLKVDQTKLGQVFRQFTMNPANKATVDSLNQVYMTGDMVAYQKEIYRLIPRIEKESGIKILKDIPEERIKAYTTVGGSPHLDDEYTVFGKVIKGLDVLDKIAAVPTVRGDRPYEDIIMTITVEEMSRKKITKEFGYEFPEQKK
jgi:cyclophilin family peptidyl-prolyl cis-trans isomerase